MSIWSSVKVFLIEAFWPWFKAYAWPVIQKHLLEIIVFFVKTLKEKIISGVNETSERQVNDFEKKATDAENLAMDSLDRDEISRLKKEAQIWREAAERLKKDNKKLKKDLDEIFVQAHSDAVETLEAIELNLDTDENSTILSIDGNKSNLPRIE